MEDNQYILSEWDNKKRLSSSSSSATRSSQQSRGGGGHGQSLGPGPSTPSRDADSAFGGSGNDVRWIPLQPFIDGLKCISDNVSEIEKQCLTLSVFHSQCKLVLFAKV